MVAQPVHKELTESRVLQFAGAMPTFRPWGLIPRSITPPYPRVICQLIQMPADKDSSDASRRPSPPD